MDKYSKEAHAGLAEMYVNDERFRAFYDAEQPGTAAFLRDAIYIYTASRSDLPCCTRQESRTSSVLQFVF